MLSPSEKAMLKNFDSLEPKARSNLVFRVSKKIKKAFSDLSEIDEILKTVPEKTARRLLNDDIVNSILTLSEDSIKILGYAQLKYDTYGRRMVIRKTPVKQKELTFEVTCELANFDDMARMEMIDDHINTLRYLISSDSGFPVANDIISHSVNLEFLPVKDRLRKWGRPRIGNPNAPEGHTFQ
jgi:hypothetical protein